MPDPEPKKDARVIRKIAKITRVTVDGKELEGIEDAPEELRKLLEDAEGETAFRPPPAGEVRVSYEYNGVKYRSLDEMPAHVRKLFEATIESRLIQGVAPPSPSDHELATEETRIMAPGGMDTEPTHEMVYRAPTRRPWGLWAVLALIAAIVALAVYYAIR